MVVLPRRKLHFANFRNPKHHTSLKHSIQLFVYALLANHHILMAARGPAKVTKKAIPSPK